MLPLDEEGGHLVEIRLYMSTGVDGHRQNDIVESFDIEDISEGRAIREESEETVEIHQEGATDIGRLSLFFLRHLANGHLAPFHHLPQVIRQSSDHLTKRQQERVFIAGTERSATEECVQETVVSVFSDGLADIGMVFIERHEPVHQFVEEREALHLRETAEIDIRSLLLHVHHLLETLFHPFQLLLLGVRMQDVVQFVGLLFLQHTVAVQMKPLLIQYLGHDFGLYRLVVALGIDAEHQLLL